MSTREPVVQVLPTGGHAAPERWGLQLLSLADVQEHVESSYGRDRANVMREILTQYEIAPICPYCPQAGDFPGHLPAQKHYQALIIDISKECYQTWTVPGGIIRFNHISGEIAACRGTAPSMMERALALEGQHLQQALPAFPASGNPAAVPPEYPTPAASSQQPYPTAGNQAVPPEYPTAGNPAATAEYPTAGYPAAFAPAPAPSQIPAQMPVQAQHHPAATPNFGLGPTSAPPQHGETMGAYPGYPAHYWNLEAPPFQPGHQESFPEVAPGAWQPPEAAAGHQEAPVFGTPAQEPANGFDQGAARHAATAPAAKTMPSEDFSSIDQMLDHFSSREHFEELLKQSSYPRVPQKPFQQQFGNGRWELDLWTLELSETESQAQQGAEPCAATEGLGAFVVAVFCCYCPPTAGQWADSEDAPPEYDEEGFGPKHHLLVGITGELAVELAESGATQVGSISAKVESFLELLVVHSGLQHVLSMFSIHAAEHSCHPRPRLHRRQAEKSKRACEVAASLE
eukprot:s757_g3.t1